MVTVACPSRVCTCSFVNTYVHILCVCVFGPCHFCASKVRISIYFTSAVNFIHAVAIYGTSKLTIHNIATTHMYLYIVNTCLNQLYLKFSLKCFQEFLNFTYYTLHFRYYSYSNVQRCY